jgi:hypothetical protein
MTIQLPKKVSIDRVKVRAARGGEEDSPVIVSIPRRIAKAANISIGDYLRIYTDGNKICLDREQIPEI